jgi:hypothetical protein
MRRFANNHLATPAKAGVWLPQSGVYKYVPDARLRGHGENKEKIL